MDKFLGKRLDGRYEINEIIGVGGMAVVYKAFDRLENKIVAIKILKDEYTKNSEFLRRFKNESKAIAVLNHPNIVKVYDVSFGDNFQYIVMEYIDGITLKEYIDKQGALSWKETLYFTVQILSALQHAHDKGIVHRDVKPQNMMLLRDGTVKVTDFGIAYFARSEQRTITDKAIGSVHYISPEQARGDVIDEKADLYSVGVLLYEMLTGRLPFDAQSAVSVAIMQMQKEPTPPREINGSIPVGLEQITMRAMRKNPDRRYHSDAEMLRDLEELKRDPSIRFNYDSVDKPASETPIKYARSGAAAAITKQNMEVADERRREKERYENEANDDDDEQRSPVIPILAAVASVLVIAFVILFFTVIKPFFEQRSGDTKVPNLIGLNYEEAKQKYTTLDIYANEWIYNEDSEENEILEQAVKSGKSVKVNSPVAVTVSLGPKPVYVPDVSGKNFEDARQAIEGKGLVVGEKIAEYNNTGEFASGQVMYTDPIGGTRLKKGDKVNIIVSKGIAKESVTFNENLVGMSQLEAKKIISKYNLNCVTTYVYNKTYSSGYVVKSSVTSGTTLKEGSDVNIYVSRGVLTVKVNKPEFYKDVYTLTATIGSSTKSHQFKPNETEYKFTFETSTEKGKVIVKVDDYVYMIFEFDALEDTLKVKTTNKLPTTEPKDDSSQTSSVTSSQSA